MATPLQRRGRRGASAIEFALCLPIFVAIAFSIIEYGWVFFQQANVIAAVREGVRFGVTLQQDGACVPTDVLVDRVRTTLSGVGYNPDQVARATISVTCTGSSPEELLTIGTDVPYTPLVGIIPTPDKIHGDMTMILEYQD